MYSTTRRNTRITTENTSEPLSTSDTMNKCRENNPGSAKWERWRQWNTLKWAEWTAGLCYNLVAYNPRIPIKQTSQSQSTLLEVHVNCTFDQTFFNFGSNVFLMLWLVSFLFALREEAMVFMMLQMVFSPIPILVYQISFCWRQLIRSGTVARYLSFHRVSWITKAWRGALDRFFHHWWNT